MKLKFKKYHRSAEKARKKHASLYNTKASPKKNKETKKDYFNEKVITVQRFGTPNILKNCRKNIVKTAFIKQFFQ